MTCPCASCIARRDRAEVWRISGLLMILALVGCVVVLRACAEAFQ